MTAAARRHPAASRRRGPSPRTPRARLAATAVRAWEAWVRPGCMALALALAWFGQDQLFARHLGPGLLLWALAGACALWAFRGQPDRVVTPNLGPRTEWWLLLGVLAVAAAFRFWRLSEVPHGYFFDEANCALIGLQTLLDPKYLPIFGPPDAPAPALFFYLNAMALKLGGINVLSTKVMVALVGTATVAMVYFLARRIVSVPVALAAALLLAVMRWHVNFSRIDFIGICTPLFAAAALYFLLRGLETRNRWHMGLSGLAVALGMYTYFASNLIPWVIGPYLVLQLAWDRKFLQEHWTGLAAFLGVSLLVFAPLGGFALSEPNRFFARNGEVLIFNHVPRAQAAAAFWSNVRATLLMFNYFGDCNGRHNIPEVPMLDAVTGVLFGLGLIWSLANLHRKHATLVVLWFLVALAPGFLTIEAPQGYRCIGAIVPVVLLAALGLERLWQGGSALIAGTLSPRWLWLGLAALLAAIGAQNATDYFDRQATNQACWSEFSAREFAIGNRVHELGAGWHSYISAGSFDFPTIRFLSYPYQDMGPFQSLSSIPSDFHEAKNTAYLLLPIHDGALEILQYYYPLGKKQVFPSPYDFMLFTEYLVPRAELLAGRGLTGNYRDDRGRRVERQEGTQGFQLHEPGQGLSGTVTARWTGSLRAPMWGRYAFRLNGAERWDLQVDGQAAPAAGLDLAQGMHAVELRAVFPAGCPELDWMWQRGANAPWQSVPGTSLSPREAVHGLTGWYYNNATESGAPFLRRVDPLLALLGADFPSSAPFSARWTGSLQAPKTGTYAFGLLCNQAARLYVDGKLVVDNETADTYREDEVRLGAGPHHVKLDFQKREGAYPQLILYWTPPGQAKAKVPFTALSPQE